MEASLQIRERTVALIGPLTSLTQHITTGLTQLGADIALISNSAPNAQRFAANINDAREINEKFGRCAAIETKLGTPGGLKDAIGKAAQSFGSVDILIDANVSNHPTSFKTENSLQNFDDLISDNLKTAIYATNEVLPFFKSKKRGRILYLTHDSSLNGSPTDSMLAAARSGLVYFAKSLSQEVQDINVTVNVLSLGYTEEYLLAHHPDCKTIKEAHDKIKINEPFSKIISNEKVTNTIAYLVSHMAAGVSGQTIRLV